MVLSIAPVRSAVNASGYFAQDGYYTKDELLAEKSLWVGNGVKQLGLYGSVTQESLLNILQGKNAQGDFLVKLGANDKHHAGQDLTFSAPKSVSIMALVAGDNRLVNAHQLAVMETLQYIENNILSDRKGELTQKMVCATFLHETNREQEPQLHTHSVVANVTQTADGQWRCINDKILYQNKMALGLVYRGFLAQKVQELGYDIKIGNKGLFEIANVNQDYIKAFSTRSKQIDDYCDKNDLKNDAITRAQAVLKTRTEKADKELPAKELLPVWREVVNNINSMNDIIALRNSTVNNSPTNPDYKFTIFNQTIQHFEERNSAFNLKDLQNEVLKNGLGHITINDINELSNKFINDGSLVITQAGNLKSNVTTAGQITTEENIIKMVDFGKNWVRPMVQDDKRFYEFKKITTSSLNNRLEKSFLNTGQRDAVRELCTATDRFIAIQGYAGVGKTTMLNEYREIITKQGYKLQGLAPSLSAVNTLSNEAKIKSQSVQKFIASKSWVLGDNVKSQSISHLVKENSKSILIIDESSLASNNQIRDVMAIATKIGYHQVVFLGDAKQLDAVNAGKAFNLMQDNGIKTIELSDIVRQKDATLLSAVKDSIAGNIDSAFQKLGADMSKNTNEPQPPSQTLPDTKNATQKENNTNIIYLNVAFDDKQRVKDMGGRWDKDKKLWYCNANDIDKFSQFRHVNNKDPVDEFLEFARSHGLEIKRLDTDGKFHRCRVDTDKGASQSGSYRLIIDGEVPRGSITNYKTGVTEKWSSKNRLHLSEDQIRTIKTQSVHKLEEIDKEKIALQNEVAKQSKTIINQCIEYGGKHNNDYLLRKNVDGYDTMINYDKSLLVPMQNIKGEIRNIQTINDSGKKFAKNGEINGNFHLIDPDGNLKNGKVIICEGFATGASVHQATNIPVMCAMNAGNIINVAREVRKLYPDMQIVIGADNDHKTENNPGLTKAQKAVDEVGGKIIYPQFNANELQSKDKLTDFNDLHNARGINSVIDHFKDAFDNITIKKIQENIPVLSNDNIQVHVSINNQKNENITQNIITSEPQTKYAQNIFETNNIAGDVAKKYLELDNNSQKNTLIIAPTNNMRSEINLMVRAGLIENNSIGKENINHTIFTNLGLTNSELKNIKSYNTNNTIIFNKDYKKLGIKKGHEYKIQNVKIENGKHTLTISDRDNKNIINISPSFVANDGANIYKNKDIQLSKNETIRWTNRNDIKSNIINSENAKIIKITDNKVTIQLANNKTITMNKNDDRLRHLDYGYASTVHASQGKTIDKVIIAMQAKDNNITNQKTFYVALSRARHNAQIFTDNAKELCNILSKNDGIRISALDIKNINQDNQLSQPLTKGISR